MKNKLKLCFDSGKLFLPAEVMNKIGKVNEVQLKLLLIMAYDKDFLREPEKNYERVAKALSCTQSEVSNAVAFWCGAGIADMGEFEEEAESIHAGGSRVKPKLPSAAAAPEYTSEELGDILENEPERIAFIDEAQRRIGRIFNTHDTAKLISIRRDLRVEDEFIYAIIDYCRRLEKTSLRYVEQVAYGMFDEGVTDIEALEEKLRAKEEFASVEGRFKTLIGAKGRRLTTKEKRFLSHWSEELKFSSEMIELAYEAAVDAKHEYNPAYMNGILERWNASGIKSVDDVKNDDAAHNKKNGFQNSSFDTDDFLEAALRRSQEGK